MIFFLKICIFYRKLRGVSKLSISIHGPISLFFSATICTIFGSSIKLIFFPKYCLQFQGYLRHMWKATEKSWCLMPHMTFTTRAAMKKHLPIHDRNRNMVVCSFPGCSKAFHSSHQNDLSLL